MSIPHPSEHGACPHCPVAIKSAGKPWEQPINICNGKCLEPKEPRADQQITRTEG